MTLFKRYAIIRCARIGRNLGLKSGQGFAVKCGIDKRLVRLAMQLDAANKAGL